MRRFAIWLVSGLGAVATYALILAFPEPLTHQTKGVSSETRCCCCLTEFCCHCICVELVEADTDLFANGEKHCEMLLQEIV